MINGKLRPQNNFLLSVVPLYQAVPLNRAIRRIADANTNVDLRCNLNVPRYDRDLAESEAQSTITERTSRLSDHVNQWNPHSD